MRSYAILSSLAVSLLVLHPSARLCLVIAREFHAHKVFLVCRFLVGQFGWAIIQLDIAACPLFPAFILLIYLFVNISTNPYQSI